MGLMMENWFKQKGQKWEQKAQKTACFASFAPFVFFA
jgi:hypothetical protein